MQAYTFREALRDLLDEYEVHLNQTRSEDGGVAYAFYDSNDEEVLIHD